MHLAVKIKKQLGSFCLQTDFTCGEDGVLGILGASGCGKSMTLKCIAGIEKPDSGHIELDGVVLFDSEKKINLPPQKRHVGYLFQNYALFPNMTVRQNILCGLRAAKNAPADREKALQDVMNLLGLNGLERHLPNQLSGGQQQRLCIARALAAEPEILLMDEPTSALDPISTGRIEELALELKERYTIVIVTHNMQQAARISDKTAFFLLGHLVEMADTKKIFSDPDDKRTEDYVQGRFG